MVKRSTWLPSLIPAFLLAILLGCSTTEKEDEMTYTGDYYAALKQFSGVTKTDPSLVKPFSEMFSDLKDPGFIEKVKEVYADDVYFNDTFTTLRSKQDIVDYLRKTADKVEQTTVDIKDIAVSDDNYYVRWVMDMKFSAGGKDITSRSIGITHLRFDSEGKVILHQDYWDGVDGFYQHLPIVGFMVRKVKSRFED